MAQTKRKRRTKHRGTAAGVVESRGRTSRPPSPEERKRAERDRRREARLSQPPTWRASINKAALAGGFMLIFLLVTSKFRQPAAAVIFAIIAMGIYIPAGYYMELYLWRRRMRAKGAPPR